MTYDLWRVKLLENATLLGRDQDILQMSEEHLLRFFLRGVNPTVWSLLRDAQRAA